MSRFKHTLWFDTETYSEVPITRGTDVYADGKDDLRGVEVMIAAWAIDDGPVKVHDCTREPMIPQELHDALHDPEYKIVAHNAYFDRTVLRHAWGFDEPIHRWHCTMAQALAHSLPAGLGLLCDVLNVETRKQENGHQLIMLFCKPRPKRSKLRRATFETHPEEWMQFLSYAADDVGAMRDDYRAMPIRNYRGDEYALWVLDQEINDHGLFVDTAFANAAIELLKADKKKNDARVVDITSGDVTAATQRDRFMIHLLNEHGILLENLKAADIEPLIDDESLPIEVRELLALRIMSAMNSTAKFTRLKNCVGAGDRLRGTRQYNGASRTGRSAGRIFNPLNLRRPSMKADDIDMCIDLIKDGDAENVELFAPSLREACSNGLRGLIIAPPGHKLVVSDWSNIEGRMAAWLAGEKWKLQAFRDFDAGVGADLYKLGYSTSFGIPVEDVDDDQQRQGGKVQELFLQYGGGVGAFVSGAMTIGLDLDHLAATIVNTAPANDITRAHKIYEWALGKGKTLGLSREVYVACEAVKHLYRKANSKIAQVWDDYESAVRQAIFYQGEKFTAGRCSFECRNDWLMVRLPSGRHLMYPKPAIRADDTITYAGQVNKQWRRIKTYGGKLLENITQAASRDVLTHNMLRIRREFGIVRWENVTETNEDGIEYTVMRKGYNKDGVQIVLDVYDEIVVEAPEDGAFNLDIMNEMMTTNPEWCPDLPLAAEGFETYRYAKH